jgi:hypothetical protein
MPRYVWRQEPPPADQVRRREESLCDGLLVHGVDAGALHRARIRALNAARQAAERGATPSLPERFGRPVAHSARAGGHGER